MLFLSYIIGLLFTLRTHAAVIWNETAEEKKVQPPLAPPLDIRPVLEVEAERRDTAGIPTSRPVRESQLYHRILGQSLKQSGFGGAFGPVAEDQSVPGSEAASQHTIKDITLHESSGPEPVAGETRSLIDGLSEEQNTHLVRQVAEMAATAATIAARDATRPSRARLPSHIPPKKTSSKAPSIVHEDAGHAGGGHDAPNWGTAKSYTILLGATLLYSIIAEILVDTVDVVLEHADIDEKFLGITLFALVPNTTEFLVRFPLLVPESPRSC
jgi:Ca2+:H+ antiporter